MREKNSILGAKRKSKTVEFVGGAGHRGDVIPASGNLVKDDEEAGDGAGHVEGHLHHVGPDHGGHTTFEGVKEREQDDQHDGGDFAGAEHDGDHQGDGEDAYTFGQGARDQEDGGGELADVFAEAAAHQFVGGEHFAAEILGQKHHRNDNAGEQVAEHDLQEAEVAAEGQSAGVPTMVRVLVSAETMERLMAHQGAVRPPRK